MIKKLGWMLPVVLSAACVCGECVAQSGADGKALAGVMTQVARYDSLGLEAKGRAMVLGLHDNSAAVARLTSWMKLYDANLGGRAEGRLDGAITSFMVSFPFECTSMYDFGHAFEPETDGFDTSAAQAGAMYPALNWMRYDSVGNAGVVLPNERMANDGYVALYLATRVVVQGNKPVSAVLELPSSTPVVGWLNGKRVAETLAKGPTPAPLFGMRYAVTLNPGENVLVVKVAAIEDSPAFYAFLSDAATGKPLQFDIDLEKPIVSGALGETLAAEGKPSVLAEIVADESISAAVRALVARQSLGQEEADRVVNGLLVTDAEKTAALPLDELEIALLAIDDPARNMVILNKAKKKYGGDPRFDLLYARQMVLVSEAQGDRGSRFADEWPEIQANLGKSAPSADYDILRRKILALSELNSSQAESAHRQMDLAHCDGCTGTLLPLVVGTMQQRGAVSSYRRAVETLYGDQQNASAYLADLLDMKLRRAVSDGDRKNLSQALVSIQHACEEYLKLHPYDDFLWNFWLDVVSAYGLDANDDAGLLAALREAGFTAEADAWYMIYLSQRMNSPQRWLKYAEHSLRRGQMGESSSAYDMASKLMAQDASISERAAMVRFLANQQEAGAEDGAFEAPYIVKDIPANHSEDAVGVVSLLDNRVVRVLPNGLASTFNQIVFEVLDEQGLKSIRAMPINYSPNDEKLEIISVTTTKKDGSVRRLYKSNEYNMADESIRMYYDQRQIVIEVPDLAVGDRIEYRFKRSQTQRASSSVSFFGDAFQLRNWFVKQWTRYTLIAPESMKIQLMRHDPDGTVSYPAKSETRDGTTVSVVETRDTPRFIAEDNMPGLTETMPVLFVSSFKSWQDMADWYIDLASPQWKIDDAIRAEVARLIDGVTDPLEKVKRIHSFVVKSTRYVALEFGIHGHKPYPVSQIFERRFGDCKDKASLLKVMLKEAGIDTEFVLVRTRQNGDMAMEQANPYLFDHAIAYVPQFDLYLDGTAEFSGTTELPVMDQDAWTFIVRDDGSYNLRKAPLSRAEDNRSKHRWVYDLSQGQNVAYTDEAEYIGFMASSYRERYQVENLQRERMESEMAYSIPGTRVDEVKFSDLTDLEAPVRYTLRANTSFGDVVKTEGSKWLVHPLVSMSRMSQSFASSTRRKLPLILMAPMSFAQNVTLVLPDKADVVLPDDIRESGKFGSYEIRAKREGNRIITDVSLSLTQTHIMPADYDDYQDFLQRFDRRLNIPYSIEVSN